MQKRTLILWIVFAVCFVGLMPAAAQGRWKVLGQRKVNHLVDHDTIHVRVTGFYK